MDDVAFGTNGDAALLERFVEEVEAMGFPLELRFSLCVDIHEEEGRVFVTNSPATVLALINDATRFMPYVLGMNAALGRLRKEIEPHVQRRFREEAEMEVLAFLDELRRDAAHGRAVDAGIDAVKEVA